MYAMALNSSVDISHEYFACSANAGVVGCVQVKDPSKAAHAADEDLKELVEFRGLEMKKDPWTEAKCSPERFEKVSSNGACQCTAGSR